MKIKVVVVDDSALMRKVLSNMINACRDMEVVDVARNGKEALRIIERSQPDLVTLDVEMPEMNGIETLKVLKERYTMPVIMLSSKKNERTTIEALELGAEDFIEKPLSIKDNGTAFQEDLEIRIHSHFPEDKRTVKVNKEKSLLPNLLIDKKDALKAITIGASTGGPKALVQVIQSISEQLSVPVFIVQHMPEGFTASFAQRLDSLSSVEVLEAQDNMRIKAGTVYLAPGGKHMVIRKNKIRLNEEAKIHGVRPAVDYLFESAAETYGKDILGLILTGMGNDGADGCEKIKQAGGYIVSQDKQTSIVYGMPRVVFERGLSDQVGSLNDIADIIKEMTR
ncbi:two-component system, chemotaxis family, response regulator CheB [Alkalibacterium putridalgicola]|uniref:Protein-glutamate methylesterase/protein-glutamine glutaminase n=1 Tax=Alkalibacterium putridalgicola TaxID=426703 RepID=A0A1H7RCX5_9LACT|nr:chemotaxis response regulator protein-glutamate methylesterase [Alkalibacterium putridalgicola]GEK88810.1 chemotaxis response regulator protein-glutamate methylesterase [Alkalibacterium putridalgicola]SEL58043.1 two-component system, chemotaxis family, response regulator CheB [Alkalibacterium putridalgicola]